MSDEDRKDKELEHKHEIDKATQGQLKTAMTFAFVLVGVSMLMLIGVSAAVLSSTAHATGGLSVMALAVAVLFATIGFGLFLIGAQGAFKMSGQQGTKVPVIESSAPGLIAMLCATAVVYFAFNGTGQLDVQLKSAPVADGGTPAEPGPADAGTPKADAGG